MPTVAGKSPFQQAESRTEAGSCLWSAGWRRKRREDESEGRKDTKRITDILGAVPGMLLQLIELRLSTDTIPWNLRPWFALCGSSLHSKGRYIPAKWTFPVTTAADCISM